MEQINSANTLATATSSDTEAPNAGTGMIEIPYIPASNRQTTQIAEDTIIVVGQRQVKKRKRTKNTTPDVSETAEGTSATKRHKSPSEDDVSECFDYSAVPNILDDLPEPERVDAKPGKGKKKKGPKGAYPVALIVDPWPIPCCRRDEEDRVRQFWSPTQGVPRAKEWKFVENVQVDEWSTSAGGIRYIDCDIVEGGVNSLRAEGLSGTPPAFGMSLAYSVAGRIYPMALLLRIRRLLVLSG
jgi:hypothetical protein